MICGFDALAAGLSRHVISRLERLEALDRLKKIDYTRSSYIWSALFIFLGICLSQNPIEIYTYRYRSVHMVRIGIGIGIGRHRGLCTNLLFIFGYTYLDIVGNWYAEMPIS